MVDRKAHVAHLTDQLKSGNTRASVMRGMADIAAKRGDHEVASRMHEALANHEKSTNDTLKKAQKGGGGTSQTGPHGGKYHLGKNGEKVYDHDE